MYIYGFGQDSKETEEAARILTQRTVARAQRLPVPGPAPVTDTINLEQLPPPPLINVQPTDDPYRSRMHETCRLRMSEIGTGLFQIMQSPAFAAIRGTADSLYMRFVAWETRVNGIPRPAAFSICEGVALLEPFVPELATLIKDFNARFGTNYPPPPVKTAAAAAAAVAAPEVAAAQQRTSGAGVVMALGAAALLAFALLR